ncbi:adenylate kinase family protein [Haloarculaceae archaeon H-GB11]|nr:adenylate kinase family protein [Haloarculaceae archaeon H-GB1-1]MEA5387402.1 adenylate kinase family protein [Haloarculaceae archaeon H-GB11]
MRVSVTGTPGTGKTTATDLADIDLDVLHLNDVIKAEGLHTGTDEDRDSLITDVAAVKEWLDGREDVLFESHLAHRFDADRAIVLRCHPETVEQRLRDRGESPDSARENAESEALDLILSETVSQYGIENVYEIDTTDLSPEQVATEIEAIVAGERDPSAGTVEFTDYL